MLCLVLMWRILGPDESCLVESLTWMYLWALGIKDGIFVMTALIVPLSIHSPFLSVLSLSLTPYSQIFQLWLTGMLFPMVLGWVSLEAGPEIRIWGQGVYLRSDRVRRIRGWEEGRQGKEKWAGYWCGKLGLSPTGDVWEIVKNMTLSCPTGRVRELGYLVQIKLKGKEVCLRTTDFVYMPRRTIWCTKLCAYITNKK